MNTKPVVFLAAAIVLVAACNLFGQPATWNGGNGNWTDSNWTDGNGPGGAPDDMQDVVLPANTGTLNITTKLNTAVGEYNNMSQRGGTLLIGSGGRADFTGYYRVAETTPSTAELKLSSGELHIGGELSVGYGADGAGDAKGTVTIEGSSVLRVVANMDTWWADGAKLTITGGGSDIEIGGTFYLGTATTLTANINATGFSTINVLGNVNFAGGSGTLDVKFVDGYVPPVGSKWTLFDSPTVGGRIPVVKTPDLGPGSLLAVNYEAGGDLGQVARLDYLNTLNLKINTVTGAAILENPVVGGENLSIDGYIIRSGAGSLVAAGLGGLGQAGWLPGLAPSQSANLLSETNFNGSSVVAQGQSYTLGSLFKTGGSQDLTLEYHLAGGKTLAGTVQYVGGLLVGDHNNSGDLDAGDLDLQAAAIVAGGPNDPYDLNGDDAVNFNDRLYWLHDLKETWVGDSNLDSLFTSDDFVLAFQAGKYEVPAAPATWVQGDWNGDQLFTSADFVAAFADGGYEAGQRPAAVSAVPEPAGLLLMLLGMAACVWRRP